ncbi:PREDICTED: uncharacterized protein LOC101290915 [Fragaria vesca subsp. vesca]|uniref:uncharacterized protein LOC101290915 n=1 Tax=Fragaria vesca subsp. vesca TaxID=101020 RepID=UPI0002C30C37|nr:PREDICTED: uncharacterized protein LOC101290915 [Fragaria vesca subsp. vesca]
MSENKARPISLFCPSVPSTARVLVSPEQRLDLGSIARTFGLDPSTVKLNGHFISRGPDLVACSVTWKSLLSFFSAKGLFTGENDASPLVVDGKLCKVGNKRRGHDGVKTIGYVTEDQDSKLVSSKKTRTSDPGCGVPNYNGICSKRKQLLEDVNLIKKLKINDTNPDNQGRSRDVCNSISNTKSQFRCSYSSGRVKRMREDEAVEVSHCKKMR